ncbi:MAG: type II toxin-antitoxin system VapC family toxin [Bacteroidales bacterium]
MKKLFLDTNIIIDLLAKRNPFYQDAATIFSCADQKKCMTYTSALSIATTHYIVSQRLKQEDAKSAFRNLKLLLNIISLDDKILELALNDNVFSDFEDGIQYYSALENKMDLIITRNLRDFKNSKIPAMTADQFIKTFNF